MKLPGPQCKCIQEIEDRVAKDKKADRYTLLDVDLFSGRTITRGELIFPGIKKKKKLVFIHSYCPACGKKYK